MCNCKGWDVLYFKGGYSITPHFCRVFDDCGHADNTLEDAADFIVSMIENEHSSYINWVKEMVLETNPEVLVSYEKLISQWKDRTHPDVVFYKEQKNVDETNR